MTCHATPDVEQVEHLIFLAEFANAAHGIVEFSEHAFAYEVTVEVDADGGSVRMAPVMRPTVRRDGCDVLDIGTDWFARFEDAYRAEAAAWLASFGGPAIGPSAWDGLVAERVVHAAIRSVESGQPVDVDPLDVPDRYR